LVAGDYFNIAGLCKECEAVLIMNLNAYNAPEVLSKSLLLQKVNLKNAATAFIEANFHHVKETSGFFLLEIKD